ncbi:MAG TPA: SH3 domain-containing protein [Phototrophicaceae bacterium]|nr:SH3 domain-containing protein [Phototrophicaceae bacterium]
MAVDLLDYLRGDGRLYELVNTFNTAEVTQTQTDANTVFYTVKNSQWEELWADDVYIYRGTDTSPGNGQLYMLSENNHYGSAWVPRWFDVGWTFKRSPTVIWRMKSNGQPVPSKPSGVAVTYIRMANLYANYTPQNGIAVQNVVELHALLDNGGQPAASPWEKYFYAQGFGLIEFQDMLGTFHSWIAQKFTPQVMPQRVREVISWLTPLQKRYYLPAAPTTTTTGQYTLTQLPASDINMRNYPDLNAKIVGSLAKNDAVTLGTPEVSGWVKAQKGSTSGWVSRQNGAVVFTPIGQPAPPPSDPGDPSQPTLPTTTPMGQYTLTQIPASWVNVRDYPDTTGNDVGDLHKGDVVTLYTPDVNGWVYLHMGEVVGWVSRQDGKVVFTAVTSTPPPDQTPIPPDDLPPLPRVSAIGSYTVSQIPATYINVRAYPDTSGADVGDLHKGDVVTLYTPDVNGWVYVSVGDMHGWVSRQNGKVVFTAAAPETAPLPHDELAPLPQVTPAGQYVVSKIPGNYISVRAYPDATGADVGNLHKGDVVTAYAPPVNNWAYVVMGDVRGWISEQNGTVVLTPYNGNGSSAASAPVAQINAAAQAVVNLPESPEEAKRLRDAYQLVENGIRGIRTELDRYISRSGQTGPLGQNGQNGQTNSSAQNGQTGQAGQRSQAGQNSQPRQTNSKGGNSSTRKS